MTAHYSVVELLNFKTDFRCTECDYNSHNEIPLDTPVLK